jgi:type IV secretion system protein VirD4
VWHAYVPLPNEESVKEKSVAGMQGQGVLLGQIGVVFGIVVAGVWGATQ